MLKRKEAKIAKYPEGKIHPYAGGGIGVSYVDASATITTFSGGVTTAAPSSDHDTSFAWQILAGFDFDLTSNLTLDLGYRYFNTKPGFEEGQKIDIKTNMATLGLKFKF